MPPRPPRALERRRIHPPGRRRGRRPRTCSPSPAAPESLAAVVAVPRLVARLAPDPEPPLGRAVWQDTRLLLGGADPALRWRNIFTGEVLTTTLSDGDAGLPLDETFACFPVALLLSEPDA